MVSKLDGVLGPVSKGHGGVYVGHFKNTAEKPVERFYPKKVLISMAQHIGAPCDVLVKVGDEVKVGQIIGDSDKYISAPIHASISGKVTAIKDAKNAAGKVSKAVEIESDGNMEYCNTLKAPDISTKELFIKAVRDSGLVGLGGAGFPTHVKLNVPSDKKVDMLIVNAAECEPFITVDYRECIDNSWDILSGVHIIQQALGVSNVIIAAEDNKPEAFKILKAIADNSADIDDSIKIMQLESKYPQGAEKVLIEAATGRQVPAGKLPLDVGCIVMNVASVSFLARYIKTGRPLVSRSLTVDGTAIKNPKNVRVPIGTMVGDIVDFCGGYSKEVSKLMLGGPMMGFTLPDDDVPVFKNNNAILAFDESFMTKNGDGPCIRCGRCVEACPMTLQPTNIEKLTKIQDHDELKNSGVNVCMECGSCAFACPSHRPLVQYMRYAKEILRREG